jgi:hypothetical protein
MIGRDRLLRCCQLSHQFTRFGYADGLGCWGRSGLVHLWTQAESESELKENLLDLDKDLTNGVIPNVRRVAELEVS